MSGVVGEGGHQPDSQANDVQPGADDVPNPPPQVRSKKFSPSDFMFGCTLGEGAYARVVHAKLKSVIGSEGTDEFAVKIMEKGFIRKEGKVKFVMMEKNVLSKLHDDLIVKLYFTFQDKGYLYMAMELCTGGELLDIIIQKQAEKDNAGIMDAAVDEPLARFYTAEIVLALRYLHTNAVVHRDLKPENILVTADGHLKITDFGTAKDEEEEGRHNTFCGTAEYVSPEVLRDQEASRGCDLWALGVLLYQLLVGRPLFRAENEYLTFQQILAHPAPDFAFPPTISPVAADLLTQLLLQEPGERLGAGPDGEGRDYAALMAHPFFEGIVWESLRSSPAPFVPEARELPPVNMDGARDEWLFEGVATELQLQSSHPKEVLQLQVQGANDDASDAALQQFLLEGESVRLQGMVLKRKGLFSKKRQLILTTLPRLFYIDPAKVEWKGEIPWAHKLSIQAKTEVSFDVVTPRRAYHLTDTSGVGVAVWQRAILDAQSKKSFDERGRSTSGVGAAAAAVRGGAHAQDEDDEDEAAAEDNDTSSSFRNLRVGSS